MKLTRSQREILKLVAERGPMDTSAHGNGKTVVSGTSANALVKRGLLRYKSYGIRLPTYRVELTDEGRKVAKTL